jgi:hypothetical protein
MGGVETGGREAESNVAGGRAGIVDGNEERDGSEDEGGGDHGGLGEG